MSDRLRSRVTVRLSREQLDRIDALVDAGVFPNRSAVLRTALEAWLADYHQPELRGS
jgi:Arc/MetJ-type ribon-helix-helix transcriptional regulator